MTKSQAMFKKAVRMAKNFVGDWSARMKLALKIVWKEVRTMGKSLNDWAAEIKDAFLEESISVSCNAWEKYGKHRIYVNAGRLKVGSFDFDDEGNFVKAWGEYSDWDMGRTSSQFKVIRNLLEKDAF